MRTFLAMLLAMTFLAPFAAAENPAQTGTGTTCAEYNVLYIVDQNTGLSEVAVQAGSGFRISADTGAPYVDFFNAGGAWIGWSLGNSEGIVPAAAAFGVVCVGLGLGWPDAPDATATWSYQDGF